MFRVLKSSNISLDTSSVVNIAVMDAFEFAPPPEEPEYDFQPPPPGAQEIEQAQRVLETARRQAEDTVRRAERDAQLIIAQANTQAKEQAERRKESSRKEGYDEGYNAGVAEATVIKQKAEEVYEKTVAERDRILGSVEADLLDLMVGILEKLIVDTVHLKPEILLTLIRKALSDMTIIGDVKLRVAPADYDYVQENKDLLMEFVDSAVKMDILKDSKLAKTDCVIETEFGLVNCSLDQQFEELKNSLYMICHNT